MRYAHPGTEGAIVSFKAKYGNYIGGEFVAPVDYFHLHKIYYYFKSMFVYHLYSPNSLFFIKFITTSFKSMFNNKKFSSLY